MPRDAEVSIEIALSHWSANTMHVPMSIPAVAKNSKINLDTRIDNMAAGDSYILHALTFLVELNLLHL